MTTRDTTARLNVPSSGTYGEGAALDDLQRSLPQMDPAGGDPVLEAEPAPQPVPPMADGEGAGLPPEIFTAPPGGGAVSLGDPAAAVPVPVDPAQERLLLLDALANSDEVSEATREFASIWLELLIGRS